MVDEKSFWLAVCEKHLETHYDEQRDGYADIFEDEEFVCDIEGCERRAEYELYKNFIPLIREPCYLVQDMGVEMKDMNWRLIRNRNIKHPLMESYGVEYL